MTQKYPIGAPSWLDLGTTDVAVAARFYGSLFGWTLSDPGPDSGGYRMFLKDGRQVAGVGPAMDPARGTSWAVYFATEDADDAARKVQDHGGRVVMEPMDVLDHGRMAVFTDPAGAFFSVWRPGSHTGAEVTDEHGSFTWAELMAADIDSVKEFYPRVLGVTTRDVPMGDGPPYTLLEADGRPVAGAMPIDPAWGPMPTRWAVYFAVDDCDAVHQEALNLGATSSVPPQDSPAGRFAGLVDPQGGAFSIIRNNPDLTI